MSDETWTYTPGLSHPEMIRTVALRLAIESFEPSTKDRPAEHHLLIRAIEFEKYLAGERPSYYKDQPNGVAE